MTNRVSYAPQDFQKMCEQAERDHESKRLAALIDRVKRQIAERDDTGGTPKRPAPVTNSSGLSLAHGRSAPFER
jgi:hypothetical protein